MDELILFRVLCIRTEFLNRFMCFVTSLGNCSKIWIVVALILGITQHYTIAVTMLIALIITAIGNNLIIKSLCMRKRPCDKYTQVQTFIKRPIGSSFPSGHSATSFACAIALAHFSLALGIPGLILASFIAVSRVYLFVHFPSDVIIGCISGMTFGWIGIQVAQLIL
jgi:undecaprenyl-diphosphatase